MVDFYPKVPCDHNNRGWHVHYAGRIKSFEKWGEQSGKANGISCTVNCGAVVRFAFRYRPSVADVECEHQFLILSSLTGVPSLSFAFTGTHVKRFAPP